tara:strand:- start:864 stop:1070 length:207 start_codon:yes stop_codon:yes gene_type:complete
MKRRTLLKAASLMALPFFPSVAKPREKIIHQRYHTVSWFDDRGEILFTEKVKWDRHGRDRVEHIRGRK